MSLFGSGLPNIEKLKAKHDVRGLIKALSYQADAAVRQQAAAALGQMHETQAVEPLIALLHDSDAHVRASAARALGELGDAHAVQPLIVLLEDKQPAVHHEAARSLGVLGGMQVVEPLISAIQRWGADFYDVAFGALEQIYGRSTQRSKIIEALTALLVGLRPGLGQRTAETLERLGWPPDQSEAGASYLILKGDLEQCAAIGAPAVQPLLIVLHGPDLQQRQAAFATLVRIGPPAVQPLIGALTDPQQDMRQAIIWALVKIGSPALEPLREALLRHPQPTVREGCARAMGQICDSGAVEPLFEAMSDENLAVREAATASLVKFGEPARQKLIAALQSPSDDVRWLAANALDQMGWQPDRSEAGINYLIARGQWDKCVAMGEIALPPLMGAIHHWADDIRKGAAWALAQLGAISVEPLIGALRSESELTRASAAWALGQLHDSRAVPPLARLLDDAANDVRLAAIGALVRLHPPCETMVAALKNEEKLVRKAAAWALGHHRERCALEPLILALQDEDTEVRQTVIGALGKLGDERAMQPLLTLVNDPNPDVRAAVAEATERIYQAQGAH